MTTHAWTTTADVPPAAWAAMCADMSTLLMVTSDSGATVTSLDGVHAPQLDGGRIAFTVTTAGGAPVTVDFTRAAGSGEVVTNSPLTGGLVHAALDRAARHFAALLSVATDADTATRAVAAELTGGLFGAGDRALVGLTAPAPVAAALADVVADALARVNTAAPESGLTGRLQALIAELSHELAGRTQADTLLSASGAPLG